MMMKKVISSVVLALALPLMAGAQKYVGGDMSMVPQYEAANVVYKDAANQRITDLLQYVRQEAGFNIIRLRLFVNPSGETGVVQDLAYVKALGKRVKDAGMALLLDFHYSDTWADPDDQWTPAAWQSLSDEQLYQKIYDYTKDCLQQMVAAGAQPDFIQTGNEISYGMCWGKKGSGSIKKCTTGSDNNWPRFRQLLSQAGKACREVCPEAKIIIHTERTGNWSTTKGIYDRLSSVDYDIIGLSYYPEWHNTVSTLVSVINSCKSTYPTKQVMVVETGYYNNWYPENATYNFTSTYPASADGQKKFLDDLVAKTKNLTNLVGLLYWFPEENPYNNHVYEPWYNHGLFNPNSGKVVNALFSLKDFLPADQTGIADVEHRPDAAQRIYDLQGRRMDAASVDQLPRGLYVVDGRKVMGGR